MRFTHYVQLAGASIVAGLGASCLVFPAHAVVLGGIALIVAAALKPLSVASEVKGDAS